MKVTGYWVYTITAPNGDVYVGMSGRKYTCKRWSASRYKDNSLVKYIDEFGWNNLKKEVVKDGMTKQEAAELEDNLIVKYTEIGICINKNRSGLVSLDCDYNRERVRRYKDEHKQEIKEYSLRYYDEHKDQCREQALQYYEEHKDQCREYSRRYYYEHKDEYRERARRNRQRKKEEKQLKELGYIKLF